MNTNTKTIMNISVLGLLLAVAPSRCFALMEITHVSKEQAKALGMEIRAKANGTNAVWVELEFKPEGKLKRFSPENNSRVELEIRDGEKLLVGSAALREKRSSSGSIVVSLMVSRGYLDKSTLTVVVASGQLSGGGYELRVKDFVEHEVPTPIIDKPFERDNATGAVGSRPKASKEESSPEAPPASLGKRARSSSGAKTVHPVGGELLPEDSLSADYWQGLDPKSRTVFLTGYRHGLGPSEDHAAKPEFRFLGTDHFATLIAKLDKFYEIPENRPVFLSAAIQMCFMELAGKPQGDIDQALKQARVAPYRL